MCKKMTKNLTFKYTFAKIWWLYKCLDFATWKILSVPSASTPPATTGAKAWSSKGSQPFKCISWPFEWTAWKKKKKHLWPLSRIQIQNSEFLFGSQKNAKSEIHHHLLLIFLLFKGHQNCSFVQRWVKLHRSVRAEGAKRPPGAATKNSGQPGRGTFFVHSKSDQLW